MEEKLLSEDAKERKAARAERMQLRNEITQKAKVKSQKVSAISKCTQEVEEQISSSSVCLNLLLDECNEVTMNVKRANDGRESAYRKQTEETNKILHNRLKQNSNECSDKYQLINSAWDSIVSTADVLQINDKLVEQNKMCMEILSLKDDMIAELKKQLDMSDGKFVADQIKHHEEINFLTDRIDNQVSVITKACAEEFKKIDQVLEKERKNLLYQTREQWQSLFDKHQHNSIKDIEMRKEIIQQYENEVDRIITQHNEDYRNEKIKLESEYQQLYQQLEQLKSLCTLNAEKLNYNYIILKHREDENLIIKNYQRKTLNKLQDVIHHYKKAVPDTQQLVKIDRQRMIDQITKHREKILELQSKANHFATTNDEQYFDIWHMNSKTVNELLQTIIQTNKFIYKEILGSEWNPPQQKLLTKEDLSSYQKAKSLIRSSSPKKERENSLSTLDPDNASSNLRQINLGRQLLNKLFGIFSEKFEILIEERLRTLLETFTDENRILIKLNNVFKALDIVSEEDINTLLQFFLPYLYCSICENEYTCSSPTSASVTPIEEFETWQEEKLVKNCIKILKTFDGSSEEEQLTYSTDCETNLIGTSTNDYDNKQEEGISRENKKREMEKQNVYTCEKGHLYDIKTSHVICVIKAFVTKHSPSDVNLPQPTAMTIKSTISRMMSVEDVTRYWTQYKQVFSQQDEFIWDALIIGLNKYLHILKQRLKLTNDIQHLKQRNCELNYLLKTYNLQN